MSLFDAFKPDLDRVKIAISNKDSFEFVRLLPRISDAEVAALFVDGDGERMWQFLLTSPVYQNLSKDVVSRLIRCLCANPYNSTVSLWFRRVKSWCSNACLRCSRDDDGHFCSQCCAVSWQWQFLEKIGLSYVAAHSEILEAVISDFWLSISRYAGKHHFVLEIDSIIFHLLDRFEDEIDVNASVADLTLSDDRIELFKGLWNSYRLHRLLAPDRCHKRYFEQVARAMAFDLAEQKVLLQWSLHKSDLDLFKLLVDIYDSDIATQTDEGFNIAMAAAKNCDIGVFKWVLSKPGGEALLYHKTYNGKSFWEFAEQSKNGELMNFMRDRARSPQTQTSRQKNSYKPVAHSSERKTRRNFDADVRNPTSQLFALMKKLGYLGRESDFRSDAKNPTNDLYKIVKGLGY